MAPSLAFAGFRKSFGPHAAALLTDALYLYTTGKHPEFGGG
jgi:hypothetical protein